MYAIRSYYGNTGNFNGGLVGLAATVTKNFTQEFGMSETYDDKGTVKRAEEFLQVFKKGAEFTQELLRENERLRYQILQIV